ncbi:MAG TPA: hypothetical protein VGG46_02990 [Terriglobales bacterium]|jgi:hypothetical protein
MAASSKVNASVEQSNISSGWDEAHGEISAPPATLEMKKKSPTTFPPPDSGATNFQTNFQTIERRVRDYLVWAKYEGKKKAKSMGRQMRWLKEEHPGYIVTAAAVAGFVGGLLLRTRRSKRRLNLYE